ncbi:MAG: hypothetical protein HC767_03910 [Akkermansiaceae bacterium]|nr:hypothetical protein [Akkermansiaceae bacterium]
MVKEVKLGDDLKSVVITMELDADYERMLRRALSLGGEIPLIRRPAFWCRNRATRSLYRAGSWAERRSPSQSFHGT